MWAWGCVSPPHKFFENLPAEKQETWRTGIEKDKRRISIELQHQRKIVLGKKATKPHLWRVTKGEKSSVIMGTIHEGVSWTGFPMNMQRCLSEAQLVVFESDGTADKGELEKAVEQQVEKAGKARAGATYKAGDMSAKAWSRFSQDLAPINPDYLKLLHPTEALNFYLTMRDSWIRGDQPFLDAEIEAEALTAKKNVKYLETVGDLDDAFDYIFAGVKEVTLAELQKIFEGDPFQAYKEKLESEYGLIVPYRDGNDIELEALLVKELGPAGYEALIRSRNQRWMPNLIKYLEAKSFVVVGIGHMFGDAGLGRILTAQGYQVEAVENCD